MPVAVGQGFRESARAEGSAFPGPADAEKRCRHLTAGIRHQQRAAGLAVEAGGLRPGEDLRVEACPRQPVLLDQMDRPRGFLLLLGQFDGHAAVLASGD
jgi:hypothetical protein